MNVSISLHFVVEAPFLALVVSQGELCRTLARTGDCGRLPPGGARTKSYARLLSGRYLDTIY